jgi:hypothetical protein
MAIGPIDEYREMDVFEFLETANTLVDAPPPVETTRPSPERRLTAVSMSKYMKRSKSVPGSTCQKPPTKFMDFVNLGYKQPLTVLTQREAWWPVMFGEGLLSSTKRN